jgi:glycosyltransferase involved in cell wall biosynthesis
LKRRILVAHPHLGASGGGNLVAAWTLQTLRDAYDASLATLYPIDLAALNRNFATSLRPGDFHLLMASDRYRRTLRAMPTRGAFLEMCLTARFAQDLDRAGRFDLLVSTQNELDFHRRGVQYVHFPSVYTPRPDYDMRWFHHAPGVLTTYNRICQRLARGTNEGLRRNVFIANSKFTAAKILKVHAADSRIIYPPVPGRFAPIPWEQRTPHFLAIGRIHHCKRWEMAVSILDQVRARGFDVNLTLIGHRDEDSARIEALARARLWFQIRYDLSRDELAAELCRHAYAIHTMEEEHFGISVAEARRAGCIPFVHNSGGPPEIVDCHPHLVFETSDDAVAKICAVLENPALQRQIHTDLSADPDRYAPDHFSSSLLRVLAEILP